ncbi:MAG: ribonuclease Z [Flavobacteriaceae bacterium]|nr:ribonuclease Z [Flavobacteriaceae bacterium]
MGNKIKLTFLGTAGAIPTARRNHTAILLDYQGEHMLIDCGEGTQSQLRKYKVKFSKIKHIFISHLHGDHFYGLIGLISTFSLLNRQTELHIFAPKGAEEIIKLQLKLSKSWIHFPLHFHELKSKKSELIFEDENVEIHTIPLKHRIYTNGFLFQEKIAERKLNIPAILKHKEIEICDYQNLKNGKDFTKSNGTIIPNKDLTAIPLPILKYAYCSDTIYFEDIIPIIKGADLLYHESTFLEDKLELATKTKHTTAMQAATIAQKAQVKKLILGHYSSRYKDLNLFLNEAKLNFENVELSIEGKEFLIENSKS